MKLFDCLINLWSTITWFLFYQKLVCLIDYFVCFTQKLSGKIICLFTAIICWSDKIICLSGKIICLFSAICLSNKIICFLKAIICLFVRATMLFAWPNNICAWNFLFDQRFYLLCQTKYSASLTKNCSLEVICLFNTICLINNRMNSFPLIRIIFWNTKLFVCLTNLFISLGRIPNKPPVQIYSIFQQFLRSTLLSVQKAEDVFYNQTVIAKSFHDLRIKWDLQRYLISLSHRG